jgi:hypothetical protein
MKRKTYCAIGALLALSLFGTGTALAKDADRDHDGHGGKADRCQLKSDDNQIKHVVYLQFDNVHFRRDLPNVPSDLEQIPNLLNFLEGQGTVLNNHHTPLISHTSVNILTSLTGVYGEKMGLPIGNTIVYYNPDGTTSFKSSFTYWTDPLEPATATTAAIPEMLDQRGKVHPAPWVPFTRAGCDVGAFSIANMELENTSSDIDQVFGPTSPEHNQVAAANALPNTPANAKAKAKPAADFEGVAIHCAQGSPLCATGKPDILSDEPGGYVGFNALFGNVNVAPVINRGQAFVNDTDGNPITDSQGNFGFPSGFSPSAAQTLGYAAQMLEAGVPVVYLYIEDMHDNHSVPSNPDGTFGPGEAGYVMQLAEANDAFGKFFDRLKKDGITKDNTLFIITADENDHFVGGAPSPANCDGINVPCSYPIKGEVEASLALLLKTEFNDTTSINLDFDSAPGIWINHNQGGQTDTVTRTLEGHVGSLIGFDPVIAGTNQIMQRMADQTEQAFLHMVTSDPRRTPNFILFSNPDYFFTTSSPAPSSCSLTPLSSCFAETRNFAWNHGDFQEDIVHTWLGIVGPGVKNEGVNNKLFTDHTDIRPTLMSLVGLKDDYAHDGRVLFDVLRDDALPHSLREHQGTLSRLADAYKAINAPVGPLGLASLQLATTGITSTDAGYAMVTARIKDLTTRRNAIAGKMIDMLEDAAFNGRDIDEREAQQLIDRAEDLLAEFGIGNDHGHGNHGHDHDGDNDNDNDDDHGHGHNS